MKLFRSKAKRIHVGVLLYMFLKKFFFFLILDINVQQVRILLRRMSKLSTEG